MKKINCLFINHFSKIGGAEIVLLNLLELLRKKNIRPMVVCPPGDLVKRIRETKTEIETVSIPLLVRTFNPFKLIWYFINFLLFSKSLQKIIKKYHIQIIHANSFRAAFLALGAAKITKTPLIWHMHDIVKYRLFNEIFIKLTAWGASKIICVSNAVRDNLINFGVNSKKCKVIYNGININNFSNITTGKFRKEIGIDRDTPLIGIIGQIARLKGQRVFVKAAIKVIKRIPRAKFVIVGDIIDRKEKNYKKELEVLIEKENLVKSIFLIGFRRDVFQIITDLDILVHSSIEPDSLPTIIIEGMALGKPIIATNVGGVPEMIIDNLNGLIVSPKNSQELAEAIIKLLDNEELIKKMGKNGEKIAKEKFNQEQNLKKILNIYQNLI